MSDENMVTRQVEVLARWESCARDNSEKIGKLTDQLLEECAEEAESYGYMPCPGKEPTARMSDSHSDFFVQNKVMIIAEYPVALTDEQHLQRRLLSALKSKWSAVRMVEAVRKEEPLDQPMVDSLTDNYNHWCSVVRTYQTDLRELRSNDESA